MNKFREYMSVGWMTQTVVKYVETKDFEKVDFIVKKIIPIEVKSNDNFTTKLLVKYKVMFNNRIGFQYVLYDKDIKQDNGVIYTIFYGYSYIKYDE